MNIKRKSAFIQLRDPGLDCPRKDCDGWIVLFGTPGPPPQPVYMQCSNHHHPDLQFRCNQPTIFSKKSSTCDACQTSIGLRDIISTGWDRKWIHFRCAHRSVKPPDVFAICLRCNLTINSIQESEPACLGGIDGYVHVGCTKRKRQEDSGDDDSQWPSSQDSLLSA